MADAPLNDKHLHIGYAALACSYGYLFLTGIMAAATLKICCWNYD